MLRQPFAALPRRVALSALLLLVCATSSPLAIARAAGEPACAMVCCEQTGICCCSGVADEAPSSHPVVERQRLAAACPEGCAQVAGTAFANEKFLKRPGLCAFGLASSIAHDEAPRPVSPWRPIRRFASRAPPAVRP